MSRVGKNPVKIASGVKVNYSAPNLEVSGKGGTLRRVIPAGIDVKVEGDEVLVSRNSEEPKIRALHGLTRTLIDNMVTGVTEGFTKSLELKGTGYRAQAKGKILNLTLGFSHPVDFELPEGVTAKVEANTKVHLACADKDVLGTTAAKIRKIRPPEPYKGKGIRFLGEQISLKQGKAAGK